MDEFRAIESVNSPVDILSDRGGYHTTQLLYLVHITHEEENLRH